MEDRRKTSAQVEKEKRTEKEEVKKNLGRVRGGR